MEKKILIGSIIAVAVLIGISFTSVVGYNNIKSDSISTSPLFKVRTDRAIGEESKILISNYFGRGNTLPFPKRDDKTVLVQKVVDSIRTMGDKTFESFIASLINNARRNDRFYGVSSNEIREVLHQVRNSNEPLPMYGANKNITIKPFIKGFKCIILLPLLLPFLILYGLFILCFAPMGTAVVPWQTSCCHPVTLKKLLP